MTARSALAAFALWPLAVLELTPRITLRLIRTLAPKENPPA